MLLAGLLLAGWGMLRLARVPSASKVDPAHEVAAPADVKPCGFGLKLSAEAELVQLTDPSGAILFKRERSAGPFTGMIPIQPKSGSIFIKVIWKSDSAPGNRFARLTLEPPGLATLTRYFESPGSIDDVWELSSE